LVEYGRFGSQGGFEHGLAGFDRQRVLDTILKDESRLSMS
jgi:hypothetical protein